MFGTMIFNEMVLKFTPVGLNQGSRALWVTWNKGLVTGVRTYTTLGETEEVNVQKGMDGWAEPLTRALQREVVNKGVEGHCLCNDQAWSMSAGQGVKRKARCKMEEGKDKVGAMGARWNPQGQTATYICLLLPGTPNLQCPPEEKAVPLMRNCTCAQPRTQRVSKSWRSCGSTGYLTPRWGSDELQCTTCPESGALHPPAQQNSCSCTPDPQIS